MTATTITPTGSVPAAVRTSFALWLGALAAGVAEMALRWSDTPMAGVGIRLGIYAVLVLVILQMRTGRNWARWTLALLLGVVGTLSLVIEPVTWLAAGNSIATAAKGASGTDLLIAASRGVHLLCVLTAVPLMFVRRANAFYRPRPVPAAPVATR